MAAERRSKATFDIEASGEMVKLTVVHDGFEPGSTVLEAVAQGWPAILASLKTLLEAGDTLPDPDPDPDPDRWRRGPSPPEQPGPPVTSP